MKRLGISIFLAFPLSLVSCLSCIEDIAIKDEVFLPLSGTLSVGQDIDLYISTEQNRPEGVFYFSSVTAKLQSDETVKALDRFSITVLKGQEYPDKPGGSTEGFVKAYTWQETDGLHELHLRLTALEPGEYDFLLDASPGVDGIIHTGEYRKELHFSVTE